VALAAGAMGFLVRPAGILERAGLIGAALLLIKPGLYTDLGGLALLAAVIASQRFRPLAGALRLASRCPSPKTLTAGGRRRACGPTSPAPPRPSRRSPGGRRMPTVLYEQSGRIVTITINRPEAMNAIDPEAHEALVAAWTRFRDDDAAWVAILTGAGERAFSAGADLKKLIPAAFAAGGPPGPGDQGLGGITRGLEIWKPMIAAINGHCLAGGLEQALACDLRVAAAHATFGLPEVRWSLMPGAGGTQRLARVVGLGKALEMILMAQTLTAAQALACGLVNAVVDAPDVMPTARRWAERICELGPLGVRAAKEAVIRGLAMALADGLRLEALLSATLRGTEDAVEGPRAFAEKRPPAFRAR
jgi:E-phenylitaconyl-CoA hydratase